jgi:hypothetical protein
MITTTTIISTKVKARSAGLLCLALAHCVAVIVFMALLSVWAQSHSRYNQYINVWARVQLIPGA